jgi:hypothetical protein
MIKKNLKYRLTTTAFFTFVLVLVLGIPAFSAQARLKFGLLLEKSEYSSDEPINVIFSLKNLGEQPVTVNQRFYVNSPESAKNQKEVYFRITSPSGSLLSGAHFYETGYPKTDYFKLLAPGQEAKSEYPRNLKGYFELTEPGTYTVEAVYQNVFGSEIGLDVFGEQLICEPVKFTVVNQKK